MDPLTIETAVSLHGHLSPGVALGLRMSEIASQQLNIKKGSKTLIAVSETNRCLPDAIQVATGCTLGHSSIIITNYGKLALSLIDSTTKEGIRITLNEKAKKQPLLKDWMMRDKKLTKDEEHDLANSLLKMSEENFSLQKIRLGKTKYETIQSGVIVTCSKCKEAFSTNIAIGEKELRKCKACSSKAYYKLHQY